MGVVVHPWLRCKGYGSGGPSWEHICCTRSNGVFVVALVLYIFYICWQLQEWGHPATPKDIAEKFISILFHFYVWVWRLFILELIYYKIKWIQNYIYINRTVCVWTRATMANKLTKAYCFHLQRKYRDTIFLWNVSNHLPDNTVAQRGHKVNPHGCKHLIS